MTHQSNIPATDDPAFHAQIAGLKEMTAVLDAADFSGSNGGGKAISDDDICATCERCDYRPGALSYCSKNWPDLLSNDGRYASCVSFIPHER